MRPGAITVGKLRVIKDIGVTRLSLGIDNFNDEILKANGRAHASKEIGTAYHNARAVGFDQINIDLIALRLQLPAILALHRPRSPRRTQPVALTPAYPRDNAMAAVTKYSLHNSNQDQ